MGRTGNYWNDLYTKEINLKEKLTIADSSADPVSNGQFTRNGNDVKVYTDGGVKNLSDIGTGGASGANTALSNLSSVAVNTTLGMSGNAISSAGQIDCTILTASGISFFDTTVYFAGTANLNATVNLGNASGDDINLKGKFDVRNNHSTITLGYAPIPIGYINITVGSSSRRLYYYAG